MRFVYIFGQGETAVFTQNEIYSTTYLLYQLELAYITYFLRYE